MTTITTKFKVLAPLYLQVMDCSLGGWNARWSSIRKAKPEEIIMCTKTHNSENPTVMMHFSDGDTFVDTGVFGGWVANGDIVQTGEPVTTNK